jgi:hypothetical protein
MGWRLANIGQGGAPQTLCVKLCLPPLGSHLTKGKHIILIHEMEIWLTTKTVWPPHGGKLLSECSTLSDYQLFELLQPISKSRFHVLLQMHRQSFLRCCFFMLMHNTKVNIWFLHRILFALWQESC